MNKRELKFGKNHAYVDTDADIESSTLKFEVAGLEPGPKTVRVQCAGKDNKYFCTSRTCTVKDGAVTDLGFLESLSVSRVTLNPAAGIPVPVDVRNQASKAFTDVYGTTSTNVVAPASGRFTVYGPPPGGNYRFTIERSYRGDISLQDSSTLVFLREENDVIVHVKMEHNVELNVSLHAQGARPKDIFWTLYSLDAGHFIQWQPTMEPTRDGVTIRLKVRPGRYRVFCSGGNAFRGQCASTLIDTARSPSTHLDLVQGVALGGKCEVPGARFVTLVLGTDPHKDGKPFDSTHIERDGHFKLTSIPPGIPFSLRAGSMDKTLAVTKLPPVGEGVTKVNIGATDWTPVKR